MLRLALVSRRRTLHLATPIAIGAFEFKTNKTIHSNGIGKLRPGLHYLCCGLEKC
jgi:hypothetical protein